MKSRCTFRLRNGSVRLWDLSLQILQPLTSAAYIAMSWTHPTNMLKHTTIVSAKTKVSMLVRSTGKIISANICGLMHNCEMTLFMDNWKSVAVNINSRCGFCAKRFTAWQERIDHLTAHFKAGARMSEWKGCRGLDPSVAAQVTNAMPPYLIGIESVSPVPFSATNKASWQPPITSDTGVYTGNDYSNELSQHSCAQETSDLIEFSSKATCWEILTVRLGKYANDMSKKGIVLTDEMLQSYARQILYDSDDTWNQTAADNPEWLDLFKKAQGLDFIPNQIGGQGARVPDDLETYGDLGLRIPFAVQLKAYNEKQEDDVCNCDRITGQHAKSMHVPNDPAQMRLLYRILAREGVLHDSNGKV